MNEKKDIWRFILQTIAAIVTAALTALGTASCIRTFWQPRGFMPLYWFSELCCFALVFFL